MKSDKLLNLVKFEVRVFSNNSIVKTLKQALQLRHDTVLNTIPRITDQCAAIFAGTRSVACAEPPEIGSPSRNFAEPLVPLYGS